VLTMSGLVEDPEDQTDQQGRFEALAENDYE
jgi:hypothetical protein